MFICFNFGDPLTSTIDIFLTFILIHFFKKVNKSVTCSHFQFDHINQTITFQKWSLTAVMPFNFQKCYRMCLDLHPVQQVRSLSVRIERTSLQIGSSGRFWSQPEFSSDDSGTFQSQLHQQQHTRCLPFRCYIPIVKTRIKLLLVRTS